MINTFKPQNIRMKYIQKINCLILLKKKIQFSQWYPLIPRTVSYVSDLPQFLKSCEISACQSLIAYPARHISKFVLDLLYACLYAIFPVSLLNECLAR